MMGTRNITRVVSNNELKVCQYGQWDGYPTGAGHDIVSFIRESDDGRMIDRLSHVRLEMPEEGQEVFVTAYPWDEHTVEVVQFMDDAFRKSRQRSECADVHEWWDMGKKMAKRMTIERYGEADYIASQLATRDTGCGVLEIIYDSTMDLTLYTKPYLSDNFGDWQIEGVYELDYDAKLLKAWWGGIDECWTFDELRAMSDDEMKETLIDLEQGRWED